MSTFHRFAARGVIGLLAFAIALSFLPNIASAGNTEQLYLPLPGKKIRHLARLELESSWVSGNGYRPVKVTIVNHPPGPTTGDRDFRVRITPHGNYGAGYHIQTESIVEMPEGSTQGTAWIAVPQLHDWASIDIEVRESGQRIDELSVDNVGLSNNAMNFRGQNAYHEAMPSVLFIDSDTPVRKQRDGIVAQARNGNLAGKTPTFDLPDVRMWQNIVPHANDGYNRNGMVVNTGPFSGRSNDWDNLNWVSQNDKVEIMPPAELPDDWLHFTCLDMIVISLDEAQKLAKNDAKKWEAIKRWAASGPTLVITGIGDKFDKLGEVDKLFAFPEDAVRPGDLEKHGGWLAARNEFAYGRVRAVDTALSVEQGYPGNFPNPNAGRPVVDPVEPVKIDGGKTPFVVRSLGLGRVVAMTSTDPLDKSAGDMAWMLNQVDARNWMGYQRHGVSFTRQNGDFMTFLIEGTGQVPVWSFLVLISGFVVVIGPVNYMLLKRWRRLFFLLVTVPAGAAIITFSLFAYAIVSDGLGVRMRARSFTRLDQRSGQASCWSRQTYYAGLSPSGGLKFPVDAAVYPIDEKPWGGGQSSRLRQLAWTDDAQQLKSGYVSSRQTSQYLALRAAPTEHKLEIKSTGANAPPSVTNELGGHIDALLLRGKDGVLYELKNLAPGESLTLSIVPLKSAKGNDANRWTSPLAQSYTDRRPQPPLGYETHEYGGGLFGFTQGSRRYYYYDQSYERGLAPPSFNLSILERELQRTCTGNVDSLEPGTYLALMKTSPEMPQGYARVKEQGSLHIIEGRW